jgi:hypothetical protein
LRHGLESHCTVGKLLALVAKPARTKAVGTTAVDEVSQDKPLGIEETTLGLPEPPVVAETENEKERKKEKKRAAIDTREQGSLF